MTDNYKLPQHDVNSEEQVCGSLLINGDSLLILNPILKADDFYSERNSYVYGACLALYERKEKINQVTVAQELNRQGKLEAIGGTAFLSHLVSNCPNSYDIDSYGGIVYRLSQLRRLRQAGEQIIKLSDESGSELTDTMSKAGKLIFDLNQSEARSGFVSLGTELTRILENRGTGEPLAQVNTGFFALDNELDGLQPDQLIILAARPAMGKTSMALNIASHNPGRTAFFSIEMSRNELTLRLISSRTGINYRTLRHYVNGKYAPNTDEEHRIMTATGELSKCPVEVCDWSKTSVTQMRMELQRLMYQNPVSLVIVDHLGLIEPEGNRENRTQEITHISRNLKAIAKEFHVPVLACCQLSRANNMQSDKRPALHHLRDSGSIEQDADVVLMIHREEYYWTPEQWRTVQQGNEGVPPAEIIIAKQRNGPTGTVRLKWNPMYTRFENLSKGKENG